MLVYTKQGDRREIPYLFAYDRGVFTFEFTGDATYTDPYDSSVWIWENTTDTPDEVLGVIQEGTPLFPVISIADCVALLGSFYWDDATSILYVHWFDSVNDYTIGRDNSSFSVLVAGYASGYSELTNNVFDGVYYEDRITSIAGLQKSVDLTKLGLVTFNSFSYTLSDGSKEFRYLSGEGSTGLPVWFYALEDTDTELTDAKRIFTGFLNGYSHDGDSIKFDVIESKLFRNNPVCPNVIDIVTYPDATDLEDELIPTAWGDIRRGIVLPINIDTLTTGASGTAKFLVADPSITAIKSITAIYDKEDNSITLGTIDLNACTVEVTKAAGISPSDLKDWKWEGEGYNITGDFDNGLDIIRAAYLYLAGIPYIESTFDRNVWENERLINDQANGISVQSDKGFTEELIEPIVTSVQGIVDILGDGKISFKSRDLTAAPVAKVLLSKQLDFPGISVDPDEVVSELVVTYSPDFTQDDTALQYVDTESRSEVIVNYGIDRRDPLSPVNTVLVDKSDVIDTAREIMSTSDTPVRIINIPASQIYDSAALFKIVGCDTGDIGNPIFEWGEVLTIDPDYLGDTQNITIRIIPDFVFPIASPGYIFKDRLFKDGIFGPPIDYIELEE
jgi:hypothetical protein